MEQDKTIREQIGLLIELQVLDTQIYALNKEKGSIPGHLKAVEDALENEKTCIKQAEEDLKNLQIKLKEKEISLQQKEEQIKKLQVQLYQLKSNKEYSAMLVEIEGIKADDSLIEEEIIKFMDVIDNAKNNILKEKELFKQEELKAQKEKDVINARVKEIDSKLEGLYAERERIVPNIEKQIMARYDRVLKNRDGLAMVSIEDGACGGCHMNLPPQVINDVKMKEDVIVCGSCSRILYIKDNVEIN